MQKYFFKKMAAPQLNIKISYVAIHGEIKISPNIDRL